MHQRNEGQSTFLGGSNEPTLGQDRVHRLCVAVADNSTAAKLTKCVSRTLMPGRARSDLDRLVSSGS